VADLNRIWKVSQEGESWQ